MSHNTAVLLVDPLNDFLHPEGKSFSMLKESLDASDTVKNMIKVVETARKAGIPIYYGLHQPTGNGAYNGWNHMRTNHHRIRDNKIFEHGSFGAEIHEDLKPNIDGGDVVASRHWNSSSFANTDLDYLLRQHNITHLVCAGMVANTCLETTARYGIELGYNVTIISDATAGFTTTLRDVAANIVWPTVMDEVLTADEWAARIKLGTMAV